MVSGQGTTKASGRYSSLWFAITAVSISVQTALLQEWFTPSDMLWESPTGLFVLVLLAATACVLTAGLLLRYAIQASTPELVGVGLFYMSVSALPLAHGITIEGVIYGENTATMSAAFWAVPLGVLVALPNLAPASIRRQYLNAYWRQWLVGSLAVIFGLATALVSLPNVFPLHSPGGSFERVVAVFAIVGTLALSWRQIRLAQIARNKGPLLISAGYAWVASSVLLWLIGAEAYSIGFWSTHLFDIAGVFAGTIGALVAYRKIGDVGGALRPIVVSDPLSALELGLEPLVHVYVADLEAKDPTTRDHVVRTAELSLRVGEELGYSGDTLRHISLVGLLHDVGKLDVPDSVLSKPGKLTDEEFDIIKRHPIDGANRARESALLAPLADGIRSHHERIDGRGYPNGLVGDAIPIEARIVAACDAYDAMTNTRQYRSGMGQDKAISILREHQGSQWATNVVNALVRVVDRMPSTSRGSSDASEPALKNVGRGPGGNVERMGCGCLPEALVAAAEGDSP